jgi:hypothetical protein
MMKNLLDKDNTFGVVTNSHGLVPILVQFSIRACMTETSYSLHCLTKIVGVKPAKM